MKRLLGLALMLPLLSAVADETDAAGMGRRVQALLHAHQEEVLGCVRAAAPSADGQILIQVEVGALGQAARAQVLKDESAGGTLAACVVGKLRTWDLGPLAAAAGDQVIFPLSFHPGKRRYLVHASPGPTTGEQALISAATVGEAPRVELWLKQLGGATRAREAGARALASVLFVVSGHADSPVGALEPGDVIVGATASTSALRARQPTQVLELRGAGTGGKLRRIAGAGLKPWPLPGGKGSVKLYLDGAEAPLALDKLSAPTGATVPPHRHSSSEELLFVLAGRGDTTIAGERFTIGPGDALRIPAGAEHSLVVSEAMEAVQVYAPGGPEQRFKLSL